jgi:hypothetical protein
MGLASQRDHLNDVICVPFRVPIMLFLIRKCRLRTGDGPPRSYEILIPLLMWSIVFEIWLPRTSLFHDRSIADHLDVLSYTAGAPVAATFWAWCYGGRTGKTA